MSRHEVYIYYYNGGDTYSLMYDSTAQNTGIIFAGDITLNARSISTVEIEIQSYSTYYGRFKTLKDQIIIQYTKDNALPSEVQFRGRLCAVQDKWSKNGHSQVLTFESLEAFLNDLLIDENFVPASSSDLDILMAMASHPDFEKYNPYPEPVWDAGITGLMPSEYADQIGKSYREVLSDMVANKNYWFSLANTYSPTQWGGDPPYPLFMMGISKLYNENAQINRLVLGIHVNGLTIKSDLTKIVNKVKIQGDGVSSTINDTTSIADNTAIYYYKKDDRFKVQSSVDGYADGVLTRYKNPITLAEVDYMDYDYLEKGQSLNNIKVGSMVDVVDKQLNSIYKGYVAEVHFNVFTPFRKKIVIGNVKENLFKEGDL